MYVVDPSLFCTSCASTSSRISLKYIRCERISVGRFFALIGLNVKYFDVSFPPSGDSCPASDFLNHCGVFISKLVDEPQVGRVHEAYVVDAPLEHCDAIESGAKCPSSIFFRIDTAISKYLRMYHPCTTKLYPPVT